MKKSNYLAKIMYCLLFTCFSSGAFAQGDIVELIKSGTGDATKLSEAYLNPFFKGFGFGMNSGWYNSAKAKKLGRFDLRIQASAAVVPTKDQSFDISTLDLSNNSRVVGSSITPTAFGEDKTGSEIELYTSDNQKVGSFNMPNGSGFSYVPSPQVQLTVGLVKNTDVSIRYTPAIGSEKDFGTVQVLGFGVKHEISKLIFGKAAKVIPVDIALGFGYNQIKYKYSVAQADQIDDSNSSQNLNQRVEANLSGYTIDAIVSKKLGVFTPFASVSYHTAKSDVGMLGRYIVLTDYQRFPVSNLPDQTKPIYTTFTDPVKIKNDEINGFRANVGFALHLFVFRIYGAYSIGQYQAVTAGIGLGIGK